MPPEAIGGRLAATRVRLEAAHARQSTIAIGPFSRPQRFARPRGMSFVLLNEPSPSQGDLHFSLLNIPVRVHPMFWLMGLILGSGGSRGLQPVVLWVVAVFVSVLVHEMGHALVIRALGVQPWITLYGMGGLTSHQGGRFRPQTQILVSLAGPAAGFPWRRLWWR